jgi:hypothetical protein
MQLVARMLPALLLSALVNFGCGSSNDGSEVGNGSGSGARSGSAGSDINLGEGNNASVGESTAVIDPSKACATGTASATLSGVNMFVMFDRSTSMNEQSNQNGTRWQLTSAALKAFFASPDASGLTLALRFFPHDQPAAGCSRQGCDMAACAAPLVGLGALTAAAAPADTQEKALIDATDASVPAAQGGMMMNGQGTPIYAALGGALTWAKAQRQKTPNDRSVVVLVTDGQANGCDEDVTHIAQLAADALASDGVLTYAIGLTGSQENDINAIARAGGTNQGIFVKDGASTQQDLLTALGAIRGQVLSCDFPMPAPKPGAEVNTNLINVNYTNGAGMLATLARVGDAAACSDSPGWYYDDPANPKRISLCPASCDAVTQDSAAKLDILLGCATVVDVPQ